MTLLNPLALLGLAAAAIPILLHILTLRRLRIVEFSTLRFLKELQRSTIRRLKLRQWLLLLLRTLFVMLLAIAFGRPALQGVFGFAPNAHSNTSAIIVLDDTPSMTSSNADGELFMLAKTAARSVLDLLEEGDDGTFIQFSDARSSITPSPTRMFEALRRELEAPRSSFRAATFEDAIRSALRTLASSRNANKELFIFSDAQADRLASSPPDRNEHLFDERTRVFVRLFLAAPTRNVSIDEIRFPDAIREPGRPLALRVRIHNHGPQAVRNHSVSLFFEGTRIAQRGIDLAAGQSMEIEFAAIPRRSGYLRGVVELEDDALGFDDRRTFSCYIPERMNVLLAGSPAGLRYLRLAFETRLSDSIRPIRLEQTDLSRLASALTPAIHVVVLSDVGAIDPAGRRALETHFARGGGMLFFPGPLTSPQAFSISSQEGSSPPIRSIERIPPSPGGQTVSVFEHIDWKHPILRTIFDAATQAGGPKSEARTIPLPLIRAYARFMPSEDAIPLMHFSGGIPFLLVSRVGNGRLLVFAAGATREWSDFPISALFAPLVRQGAAYVSATDVDQSPVLVGEPALIRLQHTTLATAQIIDPLGAAVAAPMTRLGDATIAAVPSTEIPGVYSATSGEMTLGQVSVVMDPRESMLDPASEDQIKALFLKLGLPSDRLDIAAAGTDLAQTVREARYGTELWQWFLIAALLVAIAEMLVARDVRTAMEELETNRYI